MPTPAPIFVWPYVPNALLGAHISVVVGVGLFALTFFAWTFYLLEDMVHYSPKPIGQLVATIALFLCGCALGWGCTTGQVLKWMGIV